MPLLALKRLSASDLGIFHVHFGTTTRSGQKGINLDKAVLVDRLYPALATPPKERFPVRLSVSGPAGRPAFPGQHHVGLYDKNWRLNGAFIRPAPSDPHSFDQLAPRDIAVLRFHGETLPEGDIDALFVQASDPTDGPLHALLEAVMGGRSMVAFDEPALAHAIAAAGLPAGHSANAFIADPELEVELAEAATGGEAAIRRVVARRAGRPVTAEALARAKAAAEQTGRDGETLVAAYLADAGARNPFGSFSFEWVSQANSVAPLDFRTSAKGGMLGDRIESIDVKATRNGFERELHISIGEVREAAGSPHPYRLFRVYDLTAEGAKLRRSGDIRAFAQALRDAHDAAMPRGVTVDCFSVAPAASDLAWEAAETLIWPER